MIDEGPEAKKAKFAPPMVEEVAALRECQDLYAGRLSQLKIDEILAEITLSDENLKEIRKLFETLSSDLKSMSKGPSIDLENVPARIETVSIPLIMQPEKVKGQMVLTPPTQVKLCGGFSLNSLIKLENEPITVDVLVHLPSEIMQEKDHWDERFFRKRAVYLAYVASQLNKLKKYKLEFEVQKQRIKPYLTIQRDGVKFNLQVSCDNFCKVSSAVFKLKFFMNGNLPFTD